MGAAIGAVALAPGSAFAQAVATIGTAPDKSPESARVLTLDGGRAARPLEAQPQLRVARAQTAVAEATVGQFRSPLLPQVTGVAQYGHEWGAFRTLGTTPNGGTVATNSSGLSNQLRHLFAGRQRDAADLRLRADVREVRRSAKASAEAQRYEEQVTRLTIVSTVRQAYFTARANKELVDVAQETLEQPAEAPRAGAGLRAGGYAARDRARPAAGRRRQREGALIASQNNYDTAKAQLNEAAGLVGGHGVRRDRRAGASGRGRGAAAGDARREGVRGPPRAREPLEAGRRAARDHPVRQGRLRPLARRDRRRQRGGDSALDRRAPTSTSGSR